MIVAIAAPQLGLGSEELEGDVYAAISALEPLITAIEPLILPLLAMLGIGSYAGVRKKVNSAKAEIPQHYVHEDEVTKAKDELPDGAEWKPKPAGIAYSNETLWTSSNNRAVVYSAGKDDEDSKPKSDGIEYSEPVWKDEESWFTTNLSNSGDKEDPVRRFLPADINCLWVKIKGAKAIGIQLFDNNYGLIQVDQSHDKDEDNNSETTRIEMFGKSGKRLPSGIYKVRIRAAVLGKGIGSDGDRDPEQDKLLEFRLHKA